MDSSIPSESLSSSSSACASASVASSTASSYSSSVSSILKEELLNPIDLSIKPFLNPSESAQSSTDSILLYHSILPISVTESNKLDSSTLRLSVKLYLLNSTGIGPQSSTNYIAGRPILLEITNELDPFFIYSCQLNESEYSMDFKFQQQWTVEFSQFRNSIIAALEKCRQNEYTGALILNYIDPYTKQPGPVFKIIAQMPGRSADYLIFKIRPAGDMDSKRNIRELIYSLKSFNRDYLIEYQYLAKEYIQLDIKYHRLWDESKLNKFEELEKMNQLIQSHQLELNEIKELNQLEINELNDKNQLKSQSMEESLLKEIRELNKIREEYIQLQYQYNESIKLNNNNKIDIEKLELNKHDIQLQLNELNKQYQLQSNELNELKEFNSNQSIDIKLLNQKNISQLNTIDTINKQLSIQNDTILSLNQQLLTLNYTINQLKEELKTEKISTQQLNQKFNGNKKKFQSNKELLITAETKINGMNEEIKRLTQNNMELLNNNTQSTDSQARMETQNSSLKLSLADAQMKLKEQNDTIAYLNSQLNSSIMPALTRGYDAFNATSRFNPLATSPSPLNNSSMPSMSSPNSAANDSAAASAGSPSSVFNSSVTESIPSLPVDSNFASSNSLSSAANRISQKYFSSSTTFFSPNAKTPTTQQQQQQQNNVTPSMNYSQQPQPQFAPLPSVSASPVSIGNDFTSRFRNNYTESMDINAKSMSMAAAAAEHKESTPNANANVNDDSSAKKFTMSSFDYETAKFREFSTPFSQQIRSAATVSVTPMLSASFSTPASNSSYSVASATPRSNFTEPVQRSMVSSSHHLLAAKYSAGQLSLTPDSLGSYYRAPNIDGGAKSFYDRLTSIEPAAAAAAAKKNEELPSSFFPNQTPTTAAAEKKSINSSSSPSVTFDPAIPQSKFSEGESRGIFSQSKEQISV